MRPIEHKSPYIGPRCGRNHIVAGMCLGIYLEHPMAIPHTLGPILLQTGSRTPEVFGMVRMGLAFQPTEGTTYANAAFVIGCAEAARTAEHVLVLSGSPGSTAAHTSLGFAPVLDRVVLEVMEGSGPVS